MESVPKPPAFVTAYNILPRAGRIADGQWETGLQFVIQFHFGTSQHLAHLFGRVAGAGSHQRIHVAFLNDAGSHCSQIAQKWHGLRHRDPAPILTTDHHSQFHLNCKGQHDGLSEKHQRLRPQMICFRLTCFEC